MESLDAAMLSMDALFDFSSDIGEEHNEDDERKSCKKASSLDSRTKHSATQNHQKRRHHGRQQPQLRLPAESDSDADRRFFPVSVEEEEEELEWLSNQDVFPSIETFDILPHKPSFTSPKHQSPVSVLENNTTSSNSNTNIPVRGARSKRRRRRRTSFSTLISTTTNTTAAAAAAATTNITTDAALATTRRKCQHCLAEKTPQWRAGPMGPKTLCNACGVRYKSGRLVPEYRPASSPSFSGELHSNSHRKILEMRRKKGKGIRGW